MIEQNNNSNILAILGPTNTGKTYLAFERLLGYKSGIFGFPLRLLARENYDKAIKIASFDKVALITGEEKIIPSNPKYFFCTVESMPTNIEVECVVIDEVQLCSDFERGHIFTDKILNYRGSLETIFLGSSVIKEVLKKIFPNIKISTRDRFSKLSYSKKYNISKIKPRSAVIAFNVNKVYEIAETLRSIKGGAAVVLGSLSPRTRNAQVQIYENKEVDYLVATDAIGMGLNLNIDNIIFSSLKKYDGRYNRNLHPIEISQIAGRAGRFQNDGTFGLTKDVNDLDPLIIQSIEDHHFVAVKKIYWRNSNIDFSSVYSLLNSLNKNPKHDFFIKKKNAEDEFSFRKLSEDSSVVKYLNNQENIKLLWDVCRIPDFQKIMNDNYLALLKNIFLTLIKNNLYLPEEWINQYVSKLEDFTGGIDELSIKIANIRTWTYISNQLQWLENRKFWQEKTRLIEDNLSDRLHEKLTNRFIDLSASYFFNKQKKDFQPNIKVQADKSINLDGKIYGTIQGFNLELSINSRSLSNFTHNNVKKKIKNMIQNKIDDFINAPEDSINFGNVDILDLKDEVKLFWGDEPVGILKKGESITCPLAESFNSEILDSNQRKIINKKLQEWIDNNIKKILKPLKENLDEDIKDSTLRLIVYNLFNSLGTMPVDNYSEDIKKLTVENKSIISKLGIRIGVKFLFIPNFMKKKAIELKSLLWQIYYNKNLSGNFPLPKDGRVSFISEINMPDDYWKAIGYLCINNFAVRVDIFERIFFLARQKMKMGPFIESSDLMNPIGCNSDQLVDLLRYCGIEHIVLGNGKKLFFLKKRSKKIIKKKNTKKSFEIKKNITIKKEKKVDPNSPFAVLHKLL